MERKEFYIYLLVLGGIVLIGFFIMLASMGGERYYTNQEYNHLPTYEAPKPEAIQHYEQQRDQDTAVTQAVSVADALPNNSSLILNNSSLFSLQSVNHILNPDGSVNYGFIIVYSGLIVCFYSGLFDMFGIRARRHMITSIIVASGFMLMLYLAFNIGGLR